MVTRTRFTISLSGIDEAGKTTLLSLFPRHRPLKTPAGGLDNHNAKDYQLDQSSSWYGMSALEDDDFPQNGCPDEEFVLAVASACHARLMANGTTSTKSIRDDGKDYLLPGLAPDTK